MKRDDHRIPRTGRSDLATAAGLFLCLAWVSVLVPTVHGASAQVARRLYDSGRFDAAQAEYQKLLRDKPDDARLHYNTAASAYKKGDFSGAALGFESALATDDLQLQEQSYYNLGNTLYRMGEQAAKPDEKMGHWEQALKHYGSALALKPDDTDARANKEIVQRLIEELKKQLPKQKKPNNSKDNQDKKDENDPDKDQEKQDSDQKKDDSQPGQDKQDSKDQEKQDGSKSGDDQKQQEKQDSSQSSKSDQQDKPGEEKKDSQSSDGGKGDDKKDGPKAGAGNQDRRDAQQEREAEEERKAAATGKMTPLMAEKLLDAQKGNEKAMLFRVQQQRAKGKDRVFKDW